MKKPIIIHPFLFAIFPILFLYSYNINKVSFSDILSLIIWGLGFALFLLLLFRLMLGNIKKAGILASLFLILFFSYGHIFQMIAGWQIGRFIIGRHRYLMFICSMLLICGAYFIIRTRRDLYNFTKILNVTACVIVIISLINIGAYKFKTRLTWQDIKDTQVKTIYSKETDTCRDIYYIILDAYVASSTLKEICNYDNHEFTDYLTKKSFYIASESRCNYPITLLSLASSLNMEYVNYLSDLLGEESIERAIPFRMIKDNKVSHFLRSKGYKYIHFRSGFEPTDSNRYADLNIRCGRLSEFQRILIQTTMLRIFSMHNIGFVRADRRKMILGTFAKLAEIHKIKGPKFIFAHIVCPHPPYLFDINGEPVARGILERDGGWGEDEKYLNQLIFVNKKVEVLIDKILLNSDVPPIIILQADHGTYRSFEKFQKGRLDLLDENMLKEITRIFNAYYLPADGNNLLYDSITPVNTFRLIFNFYFDANYELLDDQSFFSTYEGLYKFINITDKVKYD